MAITRGQLRRRIAGRLGDVTDLIATDNGTTTRLIDTIRLSGSIEAPKNREIVFTSGLNAGTVRRVTTYDMTAGHVDFAAVGVNTEIDDTAEMYNFRGRGWRVPEYNDAINQAISDSWPLFRQRYVYTPLLDFDSATGLVDLSGSDLTHVSNLLWQDQDGHFQIVPFALSPYGQGWSYDAGILRVVVRGDYVPNGSTMRVDGFKQPSPLDDDEDSTRINPEWLTMRACQILCMAGIDRDQANYNLGMVYGQQADALKTSIRTRIPRGTVAVIQ